MIVGLSVWIRMFLLSIKYVKVIKDKVSCYTMCNLLSSDSEHLREREKEREMKARRSKYIKILIK